MGSDKSVKAYGAEGGGSFVYMDPEDLFLVTDKAHDLYDERVNKPVKDALVASIKQLGVVESVTIWKDPETGKVCVVDGRQRTAACRVANKELKSEKKDLKLIKCFPFRGSSKDAAMVMAVANEGREEPTMMGRARMAQRFISMGYTPDQIAVGLHCSRATVENMLVLPECCKAVQDKLDAGDLTATQGRMLAKLEPEEQRKTLDAMLEAGKDEKGRNKRSKKMREAARGASGKPEVVNAVRGKKEIRALREKFAAEGVEESARELVLSVLDWVLGGKEPKVVHTKSSKSKAA